MHIHTEKMGEQNTTTLQKWLIWLVKFGGIWTFSLHFFVFLFVTIMYYLYNQKKRKQLINFLLWAKETKMMRGKPCGLWTFIKKKTTAYLQSEGKFMIIWCAEFIRTLHPLKVQLLETTLYISNLHYHRINS